MTRLSLASLIIAALQLSAVSPQPRHLQTTVPVPINPGATVVPGPDGAVFAATSSAPAGGLESSMPAVATDLPLQPTVSPGPTVVTHSPTSTDQKWGGCVQPDSPDSLIKIGERTLVCMQIGDSVNWSGGVQYIRLSFEPKADQYSRFLIPNSYHDMVVKSQGTIWQDKNITVGAAAQAGLSFLRVYSDTVNFHIYPFLTAIIEVSKGVVKGITWDDACVFCSPNECLEVTYNFGGVHQNQSTSGQPTKGCFISQEQCNAMGNSTACDLTLYVVWTGTDRDGDVLQSSNSRFSAFPAQNLQDRLLNNLPTLPTFGLEGRRNTEIEDVLPTGVMPAPEF